MHVFRKGSISVLFLVMAVSGFAQSAEPAQNEPAAQSEPAAQNEQAPTDAPAAHRMHRRNYGPPCWKQAGMTGDMVNERWKIEDQQKVSIAGVCSEASTSPQQKHDKIEQIHANTKEAIAKLIPADTLEKFNKCQADLEKRQPASGPKKELGPCGGTIPTPGAEHDHGSMKMNQ